MICAAAGWWNGDYIMKILAVDTSTAAASAALTEDGMLLGEYTMTNNKKTHSQRIMPMIDALLKDTGTDIADVDLFAAAAGPGSFTGLRIGVATVKGLAHACGKPVVSVSTLESLAYNVPYCEHIIVPIMDAGKNRVYAASYIWDEGLKELGEPEAMTIEECVDGCGELLDVMFVGDGAAAHMDYIKERLADRAFFAPANANGQRAASAACCAYEKYKNGEAITHEELNPIYLKKSQAERELEEKRRAEK